MRISRNIQRNSLHNTTHNSPEKASLSLRSIHSKIFSHRVDEELTDLLQKEIKDLIHAIERTGNTMKLQPSVQNLLVYKEGIHKLLRLVYRNAYCIRKIYGRKMEYRILNIMNARLESISQSLLAQEEMHIKIVEELDEIRGLLIDLFF